MEQPKGDIFMTQRILSIIAVALSLAACSSLPPIRIVITPTHAVETTLEPTSEVTAESLPLVTALPTVVPVIITNTAMPTNTPQPGDGSILGSILSPDYVITPPSTNTPPALPTADPNVIVPSVTPIQVQAGILDPAEMGIQFYYNMEPQQWADTLYTAQAMRLGWAKVQVDWSAMQPNSAGEKSLVFTAFVLQVQQMKSFGNKVMLSIAKAPQWARSANRDQDGPPDNPQDLIDFIQLLFTDIKVENIDALEIWNEPNLIREWRGAYAFNGQGYMQLFVPVHDAMRQLYPSVHLITAGLAPTGTSDVSVDDRTFLQQMFDNGLATYTDVSVGVHPYGWGNPPDVRCCNAVDGQGWDDDPHFFFLDTLNAYRDILVTNGFEGVQMWITEFGWASWEGLPGEAPEPWMAYTSAAEQAAFTLRAFEIGQERIDIGPMILWNFNFANDLLVANRNEKAAYSLFQPGTIRPLYTLLRDRQK